MLRDLLLTITAYATLGPLFGGLLLYVSSMIRYYVAIAGSVEFSLQMLANDLSELGLALLLGYMYGFVPALICGALVGTLVWCNALRPDQSQLARVGMLAASGGVTSALVMLQRGVQIDAALGNFALIGAVASILADRGARKLVAFVERRSSIRRDGLPPNTSLERSRDR